MKSMLHIFALVVSLSCVADGQVRLRVIPSGGGVFALTPTITATTCEEGPVQSALNAAASAGANQIVGIPAAVGGDGKCHWTTDVTFSAPANTTIIGTGALTAVGGAGTTVIVDDCTCTNWILQTTTSATGTFRLAGITFEGGTGATKQQAMLAFYGDSKLLRVDHLTVNAQTYAGASSNLMRVDGWMYGVIDHTVLKIYGVQNGVKIYASTWNNDPLTSGDESWAAATGLGSNTSLYIEDSTITGLDRFAVANDCASGGRFVFRMNALVAAGFQTHPTGGSNRARGCRAWEIYGNTWTPLSGMTQENFAVFGVNSGVGVVWGNTLPNPSDFKHAFVLYTVRRNNNTYTQGATPNGWGYCGTSFNGTGSNWDQNTSATTGYRCLDQVGSGIGQLLVNNFPAAVNNSTGTIAWPNQTLEAGYIWSMPFTPFPGSGGSYLSNDPADVAENRDFYIEAASFDGTVGVGVGLRGSRPGTCTTGVAYWSTDQGGNWNTASGGANDGTLDKCTATNAWTNAYYTPYTYPHPLNTP